MDPSEDSIRADATPVQNAALRREAQAWVVRLASGHATARDGQAFQQWCRQSPAHARAFVQARSVWNQMQPAAHAVMQDEARARAARPARSGWLARPGRRAFLGGAVAAGAGYVLVRPPWDLWPGVGLWGADYRTAVGEQRRLTLAGDVQVRMNTRTVINEGEPGRTIELVSGEAQIDTVARVAQGGASRAVGQQGLASARLAADAFVVRAGPGSILARAARLNVRYTGPQVCVTCLEGNLEVMHAASAPVFLAAGHQLDYDARGTHAPRPADVQQVSAWSRGMLVFNKVPLSEVVEELNRYRRGRIVLMSEALGRSLVQASFALDRLDEAPALIRDVYGATVTELPGGVTLLREA